MANLGTIACKLPNGLTIDHQDQTVTLVGSNDLGARFGYGMTPGVDLDWFMDWMTGPARDLPMVTKQLVFPAGNDQNAADQAREQDGDVVSGMEGLDPEKPGPGLEPTDEQRAETAKALAGGTSKLR